MNKIRIAAASTAVGAMAAGIAWLQPVAHHAPVQVLTPAAQLGQPAQPIEPTTTTTAAPLLVVHQPPVPAPAPVAAPVPVKAAPARTEPVVTVRRPAAPVASTSTTATTVPSNAGIGPSGEVIPSNPTLTVLMSDGTCAQTGQAEASQLNLQVIPAATCNDLGQYTPPTTAPTPTPVLLLTVVHDPASGQWIEFCYLFPSAGQATGSGWAAQSSEVSACPAGIKEIAYPDGTVVRDGSTPAVPPPSWAAPTTSTSTTTAPATSTPPADVTVTPAP